MSTVFRADKAHTSSSVTALLDRQPPCNLEAETCVLGSIILLPDVCDEVSMIVRPDDFYDDAHRILYEQMLNMHDNGRKIDVALLVDELKKANVFETIGGPAYIAKVANSVPNAAHAVHYAELIREHATRRKLIGAATEVLHDAYQSSLDAKTLINQAEQKVFGIMEGRGSANYFEIREVLMDAMDRIDARKNGKHTDGAVETGFLDLDNLLVGLHNSELIILAARPSMGKTAFALNITEYAAIETQKPVLFVSLEMSRIELADRILCSLAQINSHRLRNGSISKEDSRRLIEKANEVSQAPLFIDDSPSRTVGEIAAAARRVMRRQGSLGLVVVDYLQLVEPDNSNDPRQEQVAKIARRLKGLARELNVPVLCLAQLNRQAEASKDNRPRLSHLRESGAIEQDADVVMFVHREEYYRTGEEREQVSGEAEIIVAKQRNGPVGEVELLWHREFTRFVNKAAKQYDEFEQFNSAVQSF